MFSDGALVRSLPGVSGAFAAGLIGLGSLASAQAPIEIGFLWHMHQPTYRPGETILQTDASGVFSFSITDVHNQRFGPYNPWPRDAVGKGLGLPNQGAQVSFSGSLIENLNDLEAAGVNGGMWNNWEGAYRQAGAWDTAEGNPRLDLVQFGFNHPLMPLLDTRDIRMQVQLQKRVHERTWGPNVPVSKGIFPPETAFSTRIIPALEAEGIEWAIVDSIHLERATQNYPHTNSSNLYAPNPADQVNPSLESSGRGQWVQLNNLWAPSKVGAPFAYRPANVQHVDPETGNISQIVAVPAARYEGNEDGRGGFGALQYESVFEQYRQLNTDPNHPMFVLLHHDGDNFGGGSEGYYGGNYQNFINWVGNNPNYNASTAQDYLDRFPVPDDYVVHIENGSWAGADNGDPEFKKWLGDPDPNTGWSPDRNSWAVLTAAKNHVYTADDLNPVGQSDASRDRIIAGNGNAVENAWHTLLQAQASDHWYWDGTEVWDSNVTKGSNAAIASVSGIINALNEEDTAPTVFVPQRESYNPGGFEWGDQPEPSDFEVWTFAYDVSGLDQVKLKYRIDGDGFNPLDSIQNETYAGGAEVGGWMEVMMDASDVIPPAGAVLAATERAPKFSAMIEGLDDVLVDYYVEATDVWGNITRTDIQHVYVGAASVVGPGEDRVMIDPDAIAGELVTISYDAAGGPLNAADQVFAHVGFDNWTTVLPSDLAMTFDSAEELWTLSLELPETHDLLDLVFNNGLGTWDNNGGADWQFLISGGVEAAGPAFTIDGALDAGVTEIGTSGDGQRTLYADLRQAKLYVATDDAGEGQDVFVYLADGDGTPITTGANWGKAGSVGAWLAFVADENDNDYEGWFEADGAAEVVTAGNGGMLEAWIDVANELGVSLTELASQDVRLAVGAFASPDGGALVPGASVGDGLNGDGDLLGNEFILVSLALLMADINGDGAMDLTDLDALAITLQEGQQHSQTDVDQDGVVNMADLDAWLAIKGTTPGDADLDGDIDLADVAALSAAYGLGRGYNGDPDGWASWVNGDFDLDGDVDFADAMILRNHASASVGEAVIAAVPEPAAGLVLGGLGLVLRLRRA
ncbi:MAG: hypothetical protein AAGF84_03190 [Planctomycetota bacterium]